MRRHSAFIDQGASITVSYTLKKNLSRCFSRPVAVIALTSIDGDFLSNLFNTKKIRLGVRLLISSPKTCLQLKPQKDHLAWFHSEKSLQVQ